MKYIVEHLEGPLETWAKLEYLHICERVNAKTLMFTMFPDGEKILNWPEGIAPEITTESITQMRSVVESPNVCLLDMKAEKALTPQDAQQFDTFVIGGILGNVPCEDRTSNIRCFPQSNRRHLGEMQMTTDTAVAVTKIVIEGQGVCCHSHGDVDKFVSWPVSDKVPLRDIPFVDHPEIHLNPKETVELPFRYVSLAYFTRQSPDRDEPDLPAGLIDLLRE